MSPSAALGQEGLSDFPGLNDPDGLEEGWAVMQTVPSAGLSDVFLVALTQVQSPALLRNSNG